MASQHQITGNRTSSGSSDDKTQGTSRGSNLRRSTRRSLGGAEARDSDTLLAAKSEFDRIKRGNPGQTQSLPAANSGSATLDTKGKGREEPGTQSQNTPVRSTRSSTRQNFAPQSDNKRRTTPSRKSLGKRRALSPDTVESVREPGEASSERGSPNKRLRISKDLTEASAQDTQFETPSYNLRSRLSAAEPLSGSKANSTTTDTKVIAPMPKKNHRGSPAGQNEGGRSGRKEGSNSLRARAVANAAMQAHATTSSGSTSSRSHHGHGGGSSKRQRDPQYDMEAMLGMDDDIDEYDENDEDEDVFGTRVRDEDQALAIALAESVASAEHSGYEGDEHNDEQYPADSSALSPQDEEMDHEDEAEDDEDQDEDQQRHEDEDDNEDEEDEDEIAPEDEMLEDEFDAPLTFDADGNPLPSNSTTNGTDGSLPVLSGGAAEGSGASDSGSSSSDERGLTDRHGGSEDGSGGGHGADDGFSSFTSSLRGFSNLLAGLSSRLRTLLTNLKNKSEPSVRMIALQDLSELLSMSTEDTLAGYFQVDAFVKELVSILKNPGTSGIGSMSFGADAMDEDLAMAQALAASTGGDLSLDNDNGDEMQLLACRCLANLIEAMPTTSHNIVSNGAVPVLCSKLFEITFIDLAEQTISTLEKLSEEMPSSIVREGGLSALLTYLDFFSTHVQRTALTAAANCCNHLSMESFSAVRDIMPILKNVLSYSDRKLVEKACLAITGVVDSYRHHPDKLEILLGGNDILITIAALLVPTSNTSTIDSSTHPKILKLLSTAAKSSPEISTNLITESNIHNIIYQLLTGVSPPDVKEGVDGIRKHLEQDDMLILNNLVHRSKDVVQETLILIYELMPALPKDGIFDPKAHMHRSRTKVKREEQQVPMSGGSDPQSQPSGDQAPSLTPQRSPNRSPVRTSRPSPHINDDGSISIKTEEATPALDDNQNLATASTSVISLPKPKEIAQEKRLQLFASADPAKKDGLHRFCALLLPVLLDVYTASVGVQVRSKTFQNMLKIVQYCDLTYLPTVLTIVPMASFLASCFSSRDQPALIIDALQMTELLLTKVPDTYQYFFRREGVLYEIEKMAEAQLISSRFIKKSHSSNSTPGQSGALTPDMPETVTPADDGGDSTGIGTRNLPSASSIYAAVGASSLSNLIASKTSSSLSSSEALLRDSITLRARHLRKILTDSTSGEGPSKAENALNSIRALVQVLDEVSALELGHADASFEEAESKATNALKQMAGYFTGKKNMSSFEMQESGLIDGLLRFATSGKRGALTNEHRRNLIMTAFMSGGHGSEAPLTSLVKRLQEALGKAEEFDVVTALPSGGDTRQNPANMLARQLKIRLIAAEDCGIPKTVANVIVSIHAIATFQAFNDYLRPRISSAIAQAERSSSSGNAGFGGSASRHLSGVLAAFAAATGMPNSDIEAATAALADSLAPPALSSSPPPQSSSSQMTVPERRRSSRLSAKAGTSIPETPKAETSAGHDEGLTSGDKGHVQHAEEDNLEREEGNDELLNDDLGPPPATTIEDRPVNFEVAADGSHVNASTPDGTRVQTPQPGTWATLGSNVAGARSARPAQSSSSTPSSSNLPAPSSRSYAAALKSAPSDWHIEFSMDGRDIDLDMTIFGAVYQHEVRTNNQNGVRGIWHNIYNVTFRKVPGPLKTPSQHASSEPHAFDAALPDFLAKDPRQATVLRLLSVLYQINSDWTEVLSKQDLKRLDSTPAVPANVFVNNKLTAKLNRQLEEPMIVASKCLPDWALQLPQIFPFIFPFETRYTFLQSTAFGYARLMQKWLQSARTAADTSANSRRDENLSFLGRLQRQKVRISRTRLFESAVKVFELYGSSKAMLEVEYFDEVGTGLGPTLEFYSLVSKEFRKKSPGLWRQGDGVSESEYVSDSLGLFPAPIDPSTLDTESGKKTLQMFKILGTVVAKALMDSRIIDIPFNRMFMKLVLNQYIPLNAASIRAIDPTLAKSLDHLVEYLNKMQDIQSNGSLSPSEKASSVASIRINDASIEDLSLDFTVPGYDIELKENGKDISVNMDNLAEYLELVIEWTLSKGVRPAVAKFKEGFTEVFPVRDLHTFAPEELIKLFGDEDEDWSFETIHENIKADHGFSLASPSILSFIEIISHFDHPTRRKALSFFTGASRLPIGGFKSLNPPLTVVRKLPEDGLTPDSVLPSVMTCANFVKMPEYSSKEVMEERLIKAIEEGGGAFHLS